jgi:hypothetical protein
VYLRARWYDAASGTFTSVDPFDGFERMPYSLHPYQYGYSDPVRYTDPTGLNPAACTVTLLIPGPGTVITVGCLAVASILALWATATIIAIDNQDAIADWANDVDGGPHHTGHPSPPPVTDSSPKPFPLPKQAQPGENILSGPLGDEAFCRLSPFPLDSGEAPWQETFPSNEGQELVPWVMEAGQLRPDELKQIQRINDIPQWLADHPDLAADAQKVNAGQTLPQGYDHVEEAEQRIRMLVLQREFPMVS